jgi:transcriptional regulator with XRE-family HTH domain
MEIPQNLTRLRKEKGLSQTELARVSGVSQQLISQIERGENFSTKHLPELARALDVAISELDPRYGKTIAPRRKRPRTAHAVGYVGAGAEVIPIDDHEPGGGFEEVDIPPGVPENAVLVIVRGDSMYPRYFDNEYLFYVRDDRPPSEFVGRECVVALEDSRIFVKVLRRGESGLFNLESWNAPLIENKAVQWAAPVMARVNRAGGGK